MNTLLHPVGPLQTETYWRRRIALLVVVTLVLATAAAAVAVARGGTSGTSGAAAPRPPSPSSQQPSAAPTAAAPAASTEVPGCADRDLALWVSTTAQTYAALAHPAFTLHVKNNGAQACRRDLEPAALNLVVLSGSDRIWASNDCAPGGGKAVTTLAAGQERTSPSSWNRRRSAPGCPQHQPIARAGTYRVVGMADSARSGATVFRLQ